LFPFILLFSTSSMFELHVVVAGFVMFNIMELIIEIVPNYPTITWLISACVGVRNAFSFYDFFLFSIL
jgi:uncharacterized membrane protein